MAQYSQQEQNAMRQEAMRRAREMQQHAHLMSSSSLQCPMRSQEHHADSPDEMHQWHPVPPHREKAPFMSESQQFTPHSGSHSQQNRNVPLLSGLLSRGPASLLSGIDGDTMLILALMVMIYKDGRAQGCDKKLLMALAYLLT